MPLTTCCLDQRDLPLPADVAEWCPHPGAQRVLAVGTYKLDEGSQKRLGALHLFRLQGDGGRRQRLAPLPAAGLDLPGIFDLRWRPQSAMPQLAAALADGSLHLLEWSDGEQGEQQLSNGGGEPPARLAARLEGPSPPDAGAGSGAGGAGSDAMAVSLDFSRAEGCVGEQLAASYSSGQLQLFQAGPTAWRHLAVWQAHSLEAWAAAADVWHPALLHSGGDDGAYRVWDGRQGWGTPAWQDLRTHGAGVCCISSSPHQQYAVCTGSYDDRLRLWDLRANGRPLLVAALDTGGGVWRAKWHPTQPHLLLAACMYGGFAVLRVDADTAAAAGQAEATQAAAVGAHAASAGGAAEVAAVTAGAGAEGAGPALSILQRYEHAPGSLSYGADWCWDASATTAVGAAQERKGEAAQGGGSSGSGGAWLVATCSFYDHQLHLWHCQV